jgi:hypothetical protein
MSRPSHCAPPLAGEIHGRHGRITPLAFAKTLRYLGRGGELEKLDFAPGNGESSSHVAKGVLLESLMRGSSRTPFSYEGLGVPQFEQKRCVASIVELQFVHDTAAGIATGVRSLPHDGQKRVPAG